uniref:Glucose-1-phosphate cytidylyltransferase (RfbF) n=1 Tax=uncultured marine thaumarchaeote KM3_49_A08 TaxID=1456171 RepID=A0A075H9F5_9ARCH|nr:glucose-1-phosphate cytidylyltransferase (rfbF) [uncultured marine thaumarchaeote KM3_49_A08]
MQAVILAAGRGTRMGNIEIPKCLLKFGNTSLIEYQISCLRKIGINDILIVTGFNSELIKQHLGTNVRYIFNEKFESTNNLYSLLKAKEFVKEDFICLHADLLFHKNILQKCFEYNSDLCLAVEKNIRDETIRVQIENRKITRISKTIPMELSSGNFIGMVKFRENIHKLLFTKLLELIEHDNQNAYFVLAIEKMIDSGINVEFIETNNLPWIDIDETHEFEMAQKIFPKLVN